MPAAPTTPLAFDDIVVDVAGRRLLRAGDTVTLEPKAFDVLALLVANPGQALTRDQILDAVWGHRHVTPGVLNRIMTLLRHALGEEASTPRYLHTLHGVGYRFDLPAAPAANVVEAPVKAVPAYPAPAGGPPHVDLLTTWRGLAVALATALVVLLAWKWSAATQAPRPPSPVPVGATGLPRATTTGPTLIVMPLTPIGAEESSRDIAAGLSDELLTELSLIPGLQVIARESTALVATGKSAVPEMVPRLGISHALEGSLRQSGEQLRVHVRLTQALTGKTLWAQDYDRPAKDVFALQRDIARSVATALALKLGLSPEPVQRGADADFLHRYYASRAKLRKLRSLGDNAIESIEADFRTMVRQRPEDARAHAGLAVALEMRAFRRPPLAEQLRAEAAQEADLALNLDSKLSDAWQVKAAAACRANRWDDCLAWTLTASQLAPSESEPKYQYAFELASLGYLDKAEEMIRQGLSSDPLNPSWRFALGRVLDTQGRHQEALVQFSKNESWSIFGNWFNAVWRGDLDEARRVSQRMDSTLPTREYERIFKPAYVAVTEALRDPSQWPKARAAMAESERRAGLMNFLRVFDPAEDQGKLIRELQVVRQRSYSSWDLLIWTRDLPLLRRHPAFQQELRRNGMLAYWQKHGFPSQCRPTAEGADCR